VAIILIVSRAWCWRVVNGLPLHCACIAGVRHHPGKGPLETGSFCCRHGSVAVCNTIYMAKKEVLHAVCVAWMLRENLVTCAGTNIHTQAVLRGSGS
jgi:hypothetical protein